MKTKKLFAAIAIVGIVLMAGCKKDDFEGKVGVCPEVISTVPANAATGVPLNQVITVTFNENMNPATITQASFSLSGAAKLSGTLTYDGTGPTFSFTPSSPLAYNTTYTGRVSSSVKDMAGNALQKDYVWTFTTGLPQFTLSLSSNPIAGGTTGGGGSFTQGTSVTAAAVPNAGFTFTNWTEGVNVVSTNANYTFALTGDRTLVANFTETVRLYTLTVNATNGTVSKNPDEAAYLGGTSVLLTATPNPGFTFVSWSGDATGSANPLTVVMNSDKNITANFTATINTFLVVLSSNPLAGGSTTGGGSYLAGATVVAAAVPNPGYTFTNWTEGVNVVSTNADYTFTVNANRTLVANFTETVRLYTLTVNAINGSVSKNPDEAAYLGGTSVVLVATPNPGYTFVSWSGDATGSANPLTVVMNSDKNITANFTATIVNYTVTLSANPLAGGSTTGGGIFAAGSNATAAAVANTGYTFSNWTENGSIVSTNFSYAFIVNSNRTLVANFTAEVNTFSLTLLSSPLLGGSTTGAGAYTSGTSVTAAAVANAGYNFMNWTENGGIVSTNANYTFLITENRTLVANFEAVVNNYTLTLSSNPLLGGSTTGAGSYISGASVTAAAVANAGYNFINWTEGVNVVSTNANYTFLISSNRTLVANFEAVANNYTVTLSSNPLLGGSTTGAGSYISGASVTAAAVANAGYNFINWTEGVNVVSTNANYTFLISANRTLVANFEAVANNYTLTLSSNPLLGGSTTGAGSYISGASVTAAAVANAGYNFINWTEGVNVVSTNANYTFLISANRTLVANFEAVANNYTLTLSSNPLLGGSTTGAGSYISGASVTAAAVANAGYNFINWTEGVNVVSTNANYTFLISANRTLVANFESVVNAFTLNVTAVNGIVEKNPDQPTYLSGTSVMLAATPDEGYSFTGWSGDATGSANPLTVIMNSNKNITANFKKDPVGPEVDLKSAADFAIMTKAGISTTGTTSITGDIGVSPNAAASITGFGLIMDASNEFSRTPIVTGKVYAADYAAPTPAKMTTAVSDMETAYTTLNGLTVPAPVVDLYAGDISGRILPPGLYKWSTGVLITNAGVTLTGGPDDTWVFQIAQDLIVNSSAIVHLAGGAQAKNIYWVVAGQANLGTGVIFNGNILSKTLISLNAGCIVTGRLLAQTAVTIISSTIIKP